MTVGKILENRGAVITNRGQLDPVGFKLLLRILQLHELRFTERSPVGGAEEQKNGAVRSLQGLVRLLVTKLING